MKLHLFQVWGGALQESIVILSQLVVSFPNFIIILKQINWEIFDFFLFSVNLNNFPKIWE
jgi:hypothetical protein